jgi:hypothetical protein
MTGDELMGRLRQIFGPSKAEIFRQLAAEIQGNYIEGRPFKADRVEGSHGEWTVTLDHYIVPAGKAMIPFTRMRAPYVNPDAFRFTVYRKGVFTEIGKRLGMHDVEIGVEPFDSDFVIKGSDDGRLRSFFSSAKLRELIEAQSEIHLSVKDDEGWFGPTFPEGVDELYFYVPGILKDLERLKRLYELFAEALDQLCRIGSAYERSPDVKV